MAAQYEVEVTVISGKNLKNVNWRNGDLHPYAVLWVDKAAKCSTKSAVDGENSGEDPLWDEKLSIPLPYGTSLRDAVLYVDVVHANAGEDTKPLVGSARVNLADIVDEIGIGGTTTRKLKLKRPSGRPHGKIEVEIGVREPSRYHDAAPPPAAGHYAPPLYDQQARSYGAAPPPPAGHYAPPLYGQQAGSYGSAPPPPYGYGAPYGAAPPSGYPSYGYGYGAPAPVPVGGYGQAPVGGYGQPPPAHGHEAYAGAEQKKSKYGMGTGLAVGAAAGLLGGLALAEGAEYVEDKIADDVAERVEDDLGYDDGGDF